MTQNNEMQFNLITIKINKSQDEQHKIKLTAVNLDELSDMKINTDQTKSVILREVRTCLCVEILK